jgi:tRNA (guanine10-N2)-methyltransferase
MAAKPFGNIKSTITASDLNNSTSSMDSAKYYVLVEFAVRHLDFQIAELVSVLSLHGISTIHHNNRTTSTTRNTGTSNGKYCCELTSLPNDDQYPSHRFVSYSKHLDKSREECRNSTRPFAVLSVDYDSPLVPRNSIKHGDNIEKPFADNDSDIATIILSRCALVRSVIELWGMATSVNDCAIETKQQCSNTACVRNQLYQIHSIKSSSWKMTVHTLGSTYTREEQDEMRRQFTTQLRFDGLVQMNNPVNEFVFLREIELDNNGGPRLQNNIHSIRLADNNKSSTLDQNLHQRKNGQFPSIGCYFGRALNGCRSVRRMGGNIPKYDLKQRVYLGPTSMDAELSFIMTNLGQLQKGQFAFDPFVGTGSILLSCAARGAYCVGTDIDIRVLRGRSSDQNILANFRQFNLPRPELIRSDNGIYHRHFRSMHSPIYNAIICDPPYGIRAGARKSGSKRDHVAEVKPENRHDHIAQTQTYAVSDVLADLLDVASRTLVINGWLVYVIPSFATSFDVKVDLPQHPCLELVHVCYQPLSSELGRRFVAMRKIVEYDPLKRQEYLAMVWTNGPESAEKCANIRAKIIEAAKTKPQYEERAAIRKEKRRLHREEKKNAKKLAK